MTGYWNAHSDYDWYGRCNPAPEPENAEDDTLGCDCCGATVPRDQIAVVIAYGIETAACEACRGIKP